MTRLTSILTLMSVASAFLTRTAVSLSPLSAVSSSSLTSNAKTSNANTDLMHETAVAETERLFQYYNSNGKNKNTNKQGVQNVGDVISTSTSTSTTEPKSPTVLRSREEASAYIRDNIDTVLFDCDGVLYRTTSLCPGASECIRELMETQGKRVLFVTNNAGSNRRELLEKLSRLLQIDSLTNDQMISASYSCVQYLRGELLATAADAASTTTRINPPRVHVIGSSGLCEELVAAGFNVTGGPSLSSSSSMTREDLAEYDFEQLHPIDALVVGHDTNLNFRKLCIAHNLLSRNPNALFVATNKDSFDVVDGNPSNDDNASDDNDDNGNSQNLRHIVGNGATVVALEYSSKRTATNVGKPSKELFETIRHNDSNSIINSNNGKNQKDNLFDDPSRCLFVGDRLDTDIRFGKDNGMKTLLVMTGVTTAEIMEKLASGTEEEPLPDFIAPYVGMLV
mmetsp:Transcript_1767/g.3854  ORF Transcript_1767/g.3854 Transcript_1767/m.3854 type:complete len:453 (-) Transcript_1767:83-1441(-)